MPIEVYRILLVLCAAIGLFFILHALYFFIIACVGLKKQKPIAHSEAKTRFAVLVAARNEEGVIANLIDSLNKQDYPKHLYDVIVAPNNCTDNTRDAAIALGVKVFDAKGKIKGKGDVLHELCGQLLKQKRYDAICVFDADNLVHKDFLQKMNDAVQSGIEAAQGYRDSKNPSDSAVATCASVNYWMLNRFYNSGRENLKLSSIIHGCGFMVTMNMLEKLGGWDTHTLTEDYEITAQVVLAGYRVRYIADAVFYDEQPIKFKQSWNQRMRWGVGYVQVGRGYFKPLMRKAFFKRCAVSLDLLLTIIFPILQPFSLLVGGASIGLMAYGAIKLHLFSVAMALIGVIVGPILIFFACTALAAFVIWLSRGRLSGTEYGIASFALFQIVGIPIGVISLFKKDVKWKAVEHTRAMTVDEIDA